NGLVLVYVGVVTWCHCILVMMIPFVTLLENLAAADLLSGWYRLG
ncbi:22546_t:CDS:2, partial [Gigaspora rosea]